MYKRKNIQANPGQQERLEQTYYNWGKMLLFKNNPQETYIKYALCMIDMLLKANRMHQSDEWLLYHRKSMEMEIVDISMVVNYET